MDTLDAIAARRSVRRFVDKPIARQDLETILRAGIQAPSGKNRQPWRFIVVDEGKRAEMIELFGNALAKMKAGGEDAGSAEWTLKVMAQAPVTVFIVHPDGLPPWMPHSIDKMFSELVDIQSSGAAIQNMLLAAQDLGIGSLWICDVFHAYEEFLAWFVKSGEPFADSGEIVAAVSFGYPAEKPDARPRRTLAETARFL
jgi:nitroreductase